MITEEIKEELLKLQDIEYRDFQSKLIPTVDVSYFIGVRTPDLRKLAKTLAKRPDIDDFLKQLPHDYFDENQLHAFILSEMKDYEKCVEMLQQFLPYVNNWATCDQMSPKIFKKHKAELLPIIDEWIASGDTYSIRFGIKMLMEHFLDEDFDLSYPEKVAAVHSEEYYVNMMIAWYFATALAKQYDATITFIENKKLDQWCHNKAIQKSIESYRITPEQKEYLRGLKIK
ncbi:3-methyladenine DNA glycosylase AlkD [Pseudobutyrivibrio sp. UC1225]|uniref:DNA alkylation repair protein n=1 Tax=Pseudobutyrivibrio sp. UC1225 TaxID=1798185 RepID=UPI0008E15E53|nr:DNA alkylation repair protein [Pseudobutyrivibrio sp. UC1225]SFN87570.1 3-methyladenine DNA glycosylase AlkD [Pseudobutyrivibrio sp. UC1225]